jgi:hypothetical protein
MFGRLKQSYFALALSWIFVPSVYSAAPFYEGKAIKLIANFSAAGGFDLFTRDRSPSRSSSFGKSKCYRREHDGHGEPGRRQSCL